MSINKMTIAGAVIALIGLFGVYNAINDIGEPQIKAVDLEATGVVTYKGSTEFKNRRGRLIDTQYTMQYTFVGEDGETYRGQETIEREEFIAVKKGEPVFVRYNSKNPKLNAAPKYGYYVTADQFPDTPPMERLIFCSGILLIGAALLFFSLRSSNPAPARKVSSDRVAKAARSGPMFGG